MTRQPGPLLSSSASSAGQRFSSLLGAASSSGTPADRAVSVSVTEALSTTSEAAKSVSTKRSLEGGRL